MRPIHSGLVAVAAAALALAGCSSDSTTTTAPVTGGTTTGSSAATSAPPGSTAPSGTTPGTAEMMAAAEGPVTVIDTPYGPALGDGTGKALYVFDKEADGTIACEGPCLEKWPPLLADEVEVSGDLDASMFTIVERPDGDQQVAVGGQALYTMEIDEPGEANCQGADGWWIVNPDGTVNRSTTEVG